LSSARTAPSISSTNSPVPGQSASGPSTAATSITSSGSATNSLLTAFYSQRSNRSSSSGPNTTAGPQQTSNLWTAIAATARANNAALRSPVGQTVVDTLAAAGGAFAPSGIGKVAGVANLTTDLATAATHLKQRDYLALAQQGSEKIAITAGGAAGALLVPENPALGKAVGSASVTAIIDVGNFYVAPAVGDWMFKKYPTLFTPAAAGPQIQIDPFTQKPIMPSRQP
jgi:hypothetical protein